MGWKVVGNSASCVGRRVYWDGVETLFTNIPVTMWWTLTTMTTVGYGDLYPRTTMGQILGGITMLTGITVVAVAVGVFGISFEDARQRQIQIDAWEHTVEEMRAKATGSKENEETFRVINDDASNEDDDSFDKSFAQVESITVNGSNNIIQVGSRWQRNPE